MITQTFEMTQIDPNEAYQMVKDDHQAFVVLAHLSLAGSRVLRSTYRHVVFSESVFYSTEFQGVKFENCIFEGCDFSFVHIRNCQFINCSFVDCKWKASSSTISVYNNCLMDQTLSAMVKANDNGVITAERDHTTDIYIQNLLAA